MELSDQLADSTDWLPTSLPAFEPLEAALRCEICKEFYKNPVITTCAHTFCSLCIRRCIATDGKCPACKTAVQTDRLLANIAVRELVARFEAARPAALELARADKERHERGVAPASASSGGGKKRTAEEAEMDGGETMGPRTRSRQARNTRHGVGQAVEEETVVVVQDSEGDDEDDYVPEGLVRCPICRTPMEEAKVFDHVGSCTGDDPAKRTTRSRNNQTSSLPLQTRPKSSEPPPTRLSGLNYAILSESALRKKLKDLGIPNWGTKLLLTRRHQEWLNIYNSNCDASDDVRRTKREMLRELDEWERTQGGSASTKESYVMRKEFDGRGHAAVHKGQFDDLIANARKGRVKTVEKTEAEAETNCGKTMEEKERDEETPATTNGYGDIPLRQDGTRQLATATLSQTHISSSQPPQPQPFMLAQDTPENEITSSILSDSPSTHHLHPYTNDNNNNHHQAISITHDSIPANAATQVSEPSGFSTEPFLAKTPSRRVGMFEMPEEPVVDVEAGVGMQ